MIRRGMLTAALAMTLGGCNFVFGNGYSHIVDKPQADVVAALEDLDLSAQPGSPNTDLSMSGGVTPDIRLEKAADHMTWWVMAGDKVATRMIAHFEPLDGGKRTRVTTSVERGNAPDDIVSPTFRSPMATTALFSIAVEAEIDKLTAVRHASREECRAMIERWRAAGEAEAMARPRDQPGSLTQALGEGARNTIKLQAMADMLRRNGCSLDGGGDFQPVSSEMKPADDEDGPSDYSSARDTGSKTDTSADGIPDN